MQYSQIVFLLFIVMMCYYAVLIVMDIRQEYVISYEMNFTMV